MAAEAVPSYRKTTTGLYVPSDGSVPRRRDVITTDQTKLLYRTIQQVFGPHSIRLALECTHDACPDPRIEKIKKGNGFILRCGCTDRVCGGKW